MNDAEKLNRLAALARQGVPADVDPAHDDAERARFVAAVSRGAARPQAEGLLPTIAARPRWAVALAAAAALSVALVALWPAPRLDYAVEGAPDAEGGYIAADAGGDARLRFTDGSTVALSPGSALRVARIDAAGAHMLLEDGRASLRITPREEARWSVEAGPFAVLVTGTTFDVAWTRGDGTLRVELHEGSVIVRGPLARDGLPLRAGQRLTARLREGDVKISSLDADGASAGAAAPGTMSSAHAGAALPRAGERVEPGDTAAEEAAPTEGSRAGGTPASPPLGGSAAEAPSWAKRVAEGDFGSVLAEAEQRGLDRVLERGSLDDLVALGDAARYAKRGDVAQRALSATRRRFPGTSHGKAAAFLLGRIVDDGGSPGAAVAWYDTYLTEAPNGAFASEALGRKMVALERTGSRAAARQVAELYLARYPRGAHASRARDLINP